MPRKTKTSRQQCLAKVIQLRWEYARRNPNLRREYSSLLTLCDGFLGLSTDQILTSKKSKPLIDSIIKYIKTWGFSPGLDPKKSFSNIYKYRDPRKKILLHISFRIENGFIPGIELLHRKSIQPITKIPTPIISGSLSEALYEQGKVVGLHGPKMPTKVSIEIDLSSPTETIKHEFNLLLTKCKNMLKFQNSTKIEKPRFHNLEKDLEIYDTWRKLRNVRKVAQKFYKSEPSENARRKVQHALARAKNLINGAYQELA